jgi:hypothetical protein
MASKKTKRPVNTAKHAIPKAPAPAGASGDPRELGRPVFSQPAPTADPKTFVVKHASDTASYHAIDALNAAHKLFATAVPAPRATTSGSAAEPVITLAEVLGGDQSTVDAITANRQIVFHSCGDCGSTRGPKTQDEVTDKMLTDFQEARKAEIPQFHFLLGDVVYSFGEIQYYYDQFYEPYRNYPAPILAAAGNHDGMVPPGGTGPSLIGYLRNFCQSEFVVLPEAGNLSRTAQIQPGVYFTFEAPFVRIITIYSNTLEDPGVIADPTPGAHIGTAQLDFLRAALTRARADSENGAFTGAVLIAHHHPAFSTGSRHGWSAQMQLQIDAVCQQVGFWPHADLAGHAHNYQRFTRTRDINVGSATVKGAQIPYVVCGNGGHALQKLRGQGGSALRAPQVVQTAAQGAARDQVTGQVVLESYDDTDYGYLRIVVDAKQLRVEYHPASDGGAAKTPDDAVTIDLASRQIVHYRAPDLGEPAKATDARKKQTPTPRPRK